ncbi:MAG: 30S ribosomal protein S16 [Bacteroidales bacterium]|jgi:small subunit ribosomal protein S16|nr:30S ribosomal protein S16 [Bacteroidales bacterium]
MAVKIRLQRHGKKGQPFYHIVIADARAARDGKFIEKIGTYNPLTSPATINIDVDSACKWLKNGAQPTDTVRSILSYKGVLLKRHLQIGVEKGAISQETADTKFNAWLQEKENKIASVKEGNRNALKDAQKAKLAKEEEIKNARLDAIAKKRAEAEKANAQETEAASVENTEIAPETPAEIPAENTETNE